MTLVASTLASLSILTLVHSWYPNYCCSDKDCKPVDCDAIYERQDGEFVYQAPEMNYIFRKDQNKPSQDSKCHVCINDGGTPLCIFTLQGF